jgi:hypothetical protein
MTINTALPTATTFSISAAGRSRPSIASQRIDTKNTARRDQSKNINLDNEA